MTVTTAVQRFAPMAANVARARMLVRSLRDEMPGELSAQVELVISELATNAVLHAGTEFEVRIAIDGAIRVDGAVRVEVGDGALGVPVMEQRHPTGINGRGLRIVDACADDWGYEFDNAGGKYVWAEFDGDL